MILDLSIFAYILAFGTWNRLRGWDTSKISKYMPHGRILALPFVYCSTMAFTYYTKILDTSNSAILSGVITIGYLIWSAPGWGSYYDMGANVFCYKDKTEVKFIDYILMWCFGKKWALMKEKDAKKYIKFDVILEEKIRPYKWRFKRDLVGMFLRCSVFILPLALTLPILSFYNGSIPWGYLAFSAGISFFLMGCTALIYCFFHGVKSWENYNSKKTSIEPTIISEVLTGFLLGTVIVLNILNWFVWIK